MLVSAAAVTHVGFARVSNEDAMGIAGVELNPTDGSVWSADGLALPFVAAVADGLGGHPCGAEASALAIEALLASPPCTAADLMEAVTAANAQIYDAMDANAGNIGMGSTIAVVLVHQDGIAVANVGDSPVFDLADGRLHQLTIDDSPSACGLDLPGLRSSLVTQTLGGHARAAGIDVHVHQDALPLPRRLLLCTDGLSSYLPRGTIAEALHRSGTPEEAAEALVGQALASGGRDNVTVIVVDVGADSAS